MLKVSKGEPMKAITLILPHQLFLKHPALGKDRPVYILELDYFFARYSFHKHKLILHRASMQEYADYLTAKGYKVTYLDHKQTPTLAAFVQFAHSKNITDIHYAELIEFDLIDELEAAAGKKGISLTEYESPYFLTDRTLLKEFFEPRKKQYLMAAFYRKQRVALNILVTKAGKPVGGSWSYDALNREPLADSVHIPALPKVVKSAQVAKAVAWVDAHFGKNPGNADTFWYPTTHTQARAWLKNFLEKRFASFGPYEDAIDKDHAVLFHSVLTPMLNSGLLTPQEVVDKALAYAQEQSVPLQSVEGFIRQIIGWREYMYGMYVYHGKAQKKSNYFKHTRSIPQSFWQSSTGIEPVDATITKIMEHSYAHHIERLMIMGNFMLLCQFDPQQVYDWFMELFIDSYDWVMTPNVLGMSQFADGGLLATKPYISGSNYVRTMSNYPKGEWCKVWDALFWHFIATNITTFQANSRCAFMVRSLKNMDAQKRREHTERARVFLKTLDD